MTGGRRPTERRLTRSCRIRILAVALAAHATAWAAAYPDRLVWVFGWGLNHDQDVTDVARVLENAARHGLDGAVLSAGLDNLSRQTPEYFRRLDELERVCDRNHLELIPSTFSVGYGGGALAQDRQLAEGLPVVNAPFLARNGQARLVPGPASRIANGDFEDFTGNTFKAFDFHDQPGVVSFVDTQVVHGGRASLRLENFTANPYGHGRVMQTVKLHPHRCYRLSVWVRTDGLAPATAFNLLALAGDREIAPRKFDLPATTDWRKLTTIFNSLNFDSVHLYAGVWGGRAGKLWLDDWTLEEVGPLNVLHRPGTPVTVRSEDGAVTYVQGRDYAPLVDPGFNFSRVDRSAPPLRLLPAGRIQEGQRLRVSWYHPMVIYESQVTVCMAEPKLYEIWDREARLLSEHLHPRRVLLNMDEVRMGGTCAACRGRNMAELLGECITRQAQILRRYLPGVTIYVWSDMLDPNHNAHGKYYLVDGDFTGSWRHVPKDLIIAVWGGAPREKSLRFFSEQGFQTLVACYYDAANLDDVKGWMRVAHGLPGVRGFMYTPWERKYDLLAAFGQLLEGR
ncbi:MAG: hypothetical protein KGS61_13450 [Verrucomicrobia bacterium]|nr:hypothetical protein [Verrucomicrobiota bacterium]